MSQRKVTCLEIGDGNRAFKPKTVRRPRFLKLRRNPRLSFRR